MATVEKRVRNGKTSYSVRYRDPAGHSRRKVFTRKVDGDRWMAENEAARLRGAWIDPAAGREMHFLDAVQVEALADAIDPRYPTLVRFAACTGLRPCELVALRVGRLDSAELGAYLAGRPHTPDDLVFTAPLGRPLRESKFVPGYFKPAARAAGLPDNPAVLRPAAHGREPAHPRRRQYQGGAEAARARHREYHPGHLRAPVP